MAINVDRRPSGRGVPLGARVIQGQARAMTGHEVKEGLKKVVESVARNLNLSDERVEQLVAELVVKIHGHSHFGKVHLSFPRAAFAAQGQRWASGETYIGVNVTLTHVLDAFVSVGKAGEGEPVKTFSATWGPDSRPDSLREALGLKVSVEVELPTGERKLIEIEPEVKREIKAEPPPDPYKALEEEIVARKVERQNVELSDESLLATSDKVEVAEQTEPTKPVSRPVGRPRVEIGKGTKR